MNSVIFNEKKKTKIINGLFDYLYLHLDDKIKSMEYNYIRDNLKVEYICSNGNIKEYNFNDAMLLHVSDKLTGKMKGIRAISTTSVCNSYCKSMQKCSDAVCSRCYTKKGSAINPNPLIRGLMNSYHLNSRVLTYDELKALRIWDDVFRLEATGELINENHLINYIKLCKTFKRTQFVLWSKRIELIEEVFKHYEKPKNLRIIQSSPLLNTIGYKSEYADKIFTVYDKETAKNLGIYINCGYQDCRDCMACYDKHNNQEEINELLK